MILALKGATCGVATMYLFPSYMMIQYTKQQLAIKDKLVPEQLALVEKLEKEMPWMIANGVMGLVMGCIGTYRALKHNDPIHGHE